MSLIQEKVMLSPYTSWQIGGPAEYFCLPITQDQLIDAIKWAKENNKKISVLGGGSNILISDQGVLGLTICLKKYSGIEFIEQHNKYEWICLAGTSKSELLKQFLKLKLAPALFLAGLPGDVGGGVVMNAGVSENMQPREFCEITEWIEVVSFDGLPKKILSSDLKWNYRHCEGWQDGVISKVCIAWERKPQENILNQVKEANINRLSKQPLDLPSCGSVFRNPKGHKAAQLIDQCGLKGKRIGSAEVSTKHANFIVNTGGATAKDTLSLIQLVQKIVKEKAGVDLQTEVVLMGQW